MRFLLAAIVVFALVRCAAAQEQRDSLRFRYGALGGISINLHTADFQGLPGIPNCCTQFSSGSGSGAMGGVFAELPVAENVLLGLRATYVNHSALLTKQEPYRIVVNGVGQDMIDEHSMDATLSSIGLEPDISVRAIGNLFVSGGLRVGLMTATSYAQKEEIVQPAGVGTFLDSLGNDSHSRTRNVYTGTIPNASSVIAQVFAGLRYELPLNAAHTLMLAPEVSYAYSLTNVVGGLDWKASGLRAGIGIVFSPKPEYRVTLYDTTYFRDTIVHKVRDLAVERTSKATDVMHDETISGDTTHERTIIHEHFIEDLPDLHDITASIRAAGLDDDGNEQPLASLRIEEFLSTRVHPLLAYIFFGEGDSTIPSRYKRLDAASTKRFKLEQLFGEQPLAIYHTVLNIIGFRMKEYPTAKLTLTGCNSNQGMESDNRALSQARTDAVRKYLMDVWKIPAARLITDARDLPEKPSNPRSADGQEENRRVEIACDNPDVLDVFVAHDTARTPFVPQVRLKPVAVSTNGIASWTVDVAQHGATLKHYSGTSDVPPAIDWDLADDPASLPQFSEPLHVTIHAVNGKGDPADGALDLPTSVVTLEQKKARHTGDTVIDRYNLVLFNFGTSDITPAHERTVNMIKKNLRPSSSILVEGFTDRTGSSASNKILSTNRAQSTAHALGRSDIVVKGIGKDRLLYPNDTPEGRFFCRTVQITVKTPVE